MRILLIIGVVFLLCCVNEEEAEEVSGSCTYQYQDYQVCQQSASESQEQCAASAAPSGTSTGSALTGTSFSANPCSLDGALYRCVTSSSSVEFTIVYSGTLTSGDVTNYETLCTGSGIGTWSAL
jgi:hypothetical protein